MFCVGMGTPGRLVLHGASLLSRVLLRVLTKLWTCEKIDTDEV